MEHEHIAPAGSPDSIILLGPRREVLAWNDAAERLYGWSSTEMMGALAHDRLCCTIPAHPELTPLSVPVHFRGVFRRLARDGSLKAVEVLRMPYGAFGAAPRGVLEFGRDITRRPDPHPGAADDVPCAAPAPPPTPRIELDVRALADTLRAWRDQGADIHRVMSTNAALVRALLATVRVIAVNAGAARLFGSVDGRLLPDELDAIWPVESLPTLAASVLAATEGAGESSAGCTLHTLTGRRFSALLTASRLHGAPDGCVAVGIIDVSSR
ncbi:MAG: PAS domain-containing protein, partial [Luteibacter sp.]